MNANELMIGDWVNIQIGPDGDPIYSQVEQLLEYEIDANFQTVYKNVYPIELTKEILHKNGFIGEVYLWLNVGDDKILEYYPFEHRLSLYYVKEERQELLFRCQCFRVHEFQHALKLCGIEKEIVL